MERLRILRGKEQIENLQNLAQEVSEENVRKNLQSQIEELSGASGKSVPSLFVCTKVLNYSHNN
jgi:hypothetical protein